ncbi:MAG: extensin family protein [Xanthobacteraceae bacterium]|nr:extensin family protein [Xanthobacteraceae bacterium]
MDISARNAAGECHCGPNRCGERPIWFLAASLAGLLALTASALAVPMPRPRPQLPADAAPAQEPPPAAADSPAAPSPCRLALTEAVAIAPSIPPVRGPGACGGDDLVRLEAVVLPDGRRVAVKPHATLRCTMATAVAGWVREDVAALAAGLGTTVSELDNFDSFECRGRNRVAGAKLSEHGRANALDVRGVKFANGKTLSLTDRDAPREAREKAMASVCARFTTVLGPGSDGYHEDHIHLDLAERRNGYRICQWMIRDTATEIATPLPPPRPPEAPPRELASREEEAPRADTRQVEEVKVQPTAPPPALSLSPVPLARQPADVAKPVAPKPVTAKSVASKPAPPPMRIAPDPKPSAQPAARPKTARAKSRRGEPDLPRALRRIFQ